MKPMAFVPLGESVEVIVPVQPSESKESLAFIKPKEFTEEMESLALITWEEYSASVKRKRLSGFYATLSWASLPDVRSLLKKGVVSILKFGSDLPQWFTGEFLVWLAIRKMLHPHGAKRHALRLTPYARAITHMEKQVVMFNRSYPSFGLAARLTSVQLIS